jgi:hypothetical protein
MTKYLVIFPKNKDAEKMLIKLIAGKALETAKNKLSRYRLEFNFFIILKPVRLILEADNPALLTVTRKLIEKAIPSNILTFKEFNKKDEAFNYGGRN